MFNIIITYTHPLKRIKCSLTVLLHCINNLLTVFLGTSSGVWPKYWQVLYLLLTLIQISSLTTNQDLTQSPHEW